MQIVHGFWMSVWNELVWLWKSVLHFSYSSICYTQELTIQLVLWFQAEALETHWLDIEHSLY